MRIEYAMKSAPQSEAELLALYKASHGRLRGVPPPKIAKIIEAEPILVEPQLAEPVPVPCAAKEIRRYRKSAYVQDKGNYGFMDIVETPAPTIMHIKTIVAKKRKTSALELESARRTAHVCAARHVAVYLCATMSRRSLPSIGKQFGDRDHTTMLHSRDKVAGLITKDIHLNEEILALKAEILATMVDDEVDS